MEYVVCLKREIELLNEHEAQKRFLELTAMGYKEQDILLAAPVPVQVYLNIGSNREAHANPSSASSMVNGVQSTAIPGYPMSMPSAQQNNGNYSEMTMATENGEFDPAQTGTEMSIFRNTGNPSPNAELPSDTIS